MKKRIFQDLAEIKQSWYSHLWKYFLVSMVFHILLIYLLLTVPLTTPIDRSLLEARPPAMKETAKKHSYTPDTLDTHADGKANRSQEYGGGYSEYTESAGNETNAGNVIQEEPREIVYVYNEDKEPEETPAAESGQQQTGKPLPVNVTIYKYQVPVSRRPLDFNSDQYVRLYDKPFQAVRENPLSAFPGKKRAVFPPLKIKEIIEETQIPPQQLVKIEEMMDYLYYDYPLPTGEQPFSLTAELADCPWEPDHLLLHIGLQGKIIAGDKIKNQAFIIAKDVKMEVVFNPVHISAYRLLGLGHRRPKLGKPSFTDQWTEPKELLMGQSLTTLYEIIPMIPGTENNTTAENPAKPNQPEKQEMAHVKVIYKEPGNPKTIAVSMGVSPPTPEIKDEEKGGNQ